MILWQELVWSWLRFTLWGLADVLVRLKLLVAPLICLQAGAWCASASRQNLPLGPHWFRFHQDILLPHRPGTGKGCICSTRSQSTHTVNHQGCSGQTFFIPILRGGGRVRLPWLLSVGCGHLPCGQDLLTTDLTPWVSCPRFVFCGVPVPSSVGTYAYMSKYCLTIIV